MHGNVNEYEPKLNLPVNKITNMPINYELLIEMIEPSQRNNGVNYESNKEQ